MGRKRAIGAPQAKSRHCPGLQVLSAGSMVPRVALPLPQGHLGVRDRDSLLCIRARARPATPAGGPMRRSWMVPTGLHRSKRLGATTVRVLADRRPEDGCSRGLTRVGLLLDEPNND